MGSILNEAQPNGLVDPFDSQVVDYTRLMGTAREREAELKLFDRALQDFGFCYLKNHSVPIELYNKVHTYAQNFFDSDDELKLTVARRNGQDFGDHRGFHGLGVGRVTNSHDREEIMRLRKEQPDHMEGFQMGNPYGDGETNPNIWLPEDKFPGFRTTIEDWWDANVRLEKELMRCLCAILEIEDLEHIGKMQQFDVSHMSMLHYPPMTVEQFLKDSHKRLNAHSDYGSFTLLYQDSLGGLEVLDEDEQVFKPVLPKKDMVLVHIGDMLERMSNGRWRSPLHQVAAPQWVAQQKGLKPDDLVGERLSVVYFGAFDMKTVIRTLPGCEVPGKWLPRMLEEGDQALTARQWMDKRFEIEYFD